MFTAYESDRDTFNPYGCRSQARNGIAGLLFAEDAETEIGANLAFGVWQVFGISGSLSTTSLNAHAVWGQGILYTVFYEQAVRRRLVSTKLSIREKQIAGIGASV